MNEFHVMQDFAFEGKRLPVGDVLRLSDPFLARVIKEWPWPSNFFSGAGTHRATRTRKPPAEAGRLAGST